MRCLYWKEATLERIHEIIQYKGKTINRDFNDDLVLHITHTYRAKLLKIERNINLMGDNHRIFNNYSSIQMTTSKSIMNKMPYIITNNIVKVLHYLIIHISRGIHFSIFVDNASLNY